MKKVLLLGQKEYIEKEWKDIDEFQDVYFMEGSPIRREDVISAGVQNCLMCLILSSALQSKATDPNLVDKETILSFLQVQFRYRKYNSVQFRYRKYNSDIENTIQVQFRYRKYNSGVIQIQKIQFRYNSDIENTIQVQFRYRKYR